ncbi:hypothetical protein ACQPUY_14880 [Clostridium nigeriense]|uniref:hypothetical protein n=1 Tax=Clostridium nigeriense TaxID=1805470 RepID=UPI003D330FC7
MRINGERSCICSRCGKRFVIKTGDNISDNDFKNMLYCNKCKLILLLYKKHS